VGGEGESDHHIEILTTPSLGLMCKGKLRTARTPSSSTKYKD